MGQRAVNRKGWGDGVPTVLPADLMPQWVPSGAWTPDPANPNNALVTKAYGVGPQGTYSIYTTIHLPSIYVTEITDNWYYVATPPLAWTSEQIKFKAHFIVEDTLSLPGAFRVGIGFRRQQEPSVVIGAKSYVYADYTLPDTNIPRYRITGFSTAVTLTGAQAGEGFLCELYRDSALENEEQVPIYVVGIELHYI